MPRGVAVEVLLFPVSPVLNEPIPVTWMTGGIQSPAPELTIVRIGTALYAFSQLRGIRKSIRATF